MPSTSSYAETIASLTDEELLALIPPTISPPFIVVMIPNGDGTSFRHQIPVHEGDTRELIADSLRFFCQDLLAD